MWLKLSPAARNGWLLALPLAAIGCQAERGQSMLHPASSAAEQIAWLWWFLLILCTVVFAAVLLLTGLAVRRLPEGSRRESPLGDRFILLCGVLLPAVALVAILLVSLRTQLALRTPATELTIEVTGFQWWWEVRYPEQAILTANEIYIPVGEPVRLELTSGDVIHSFWTPNLSGKTDMIPGLTNVAWIEADRPGVYRGQCAEYCGVQHAWMAFEVIAVPREEFDAWVAARRAATAEPATPQQRRGREVFYQARCNNCHAVADTPWMGEHGPDLTHFGSRRTLGAGLMPNNRENLEAWIIDPQAHKPGNRMPETTLSEDDLQALLAYLEHLK